MLTITDIQNWIGSDSTQTDILQILADIANGSYTPEQLAQDIQSTMEANHE